MMTWAGLNISYTSGRCENVSLLEINTIKVIVVASTPSALTCAEIYEGLSHLFRPFRLNRKMMELLAKPFQCNRFSSARRIQAVLSHRAANPVLSKRQRRQADELCSMVPRLYMLLRCRREDPDGDILSAARPITL